MPDSTRILERVPAVLVHEGVAFGADGNWSEAFPREAVAIVTQKWRLATATSHFSFLNVGRFPGTAVLNQL